VNHKRGGPLKLIATLRGQGSFLAAARRIPVTYQVDLYRRGGGQLASGEVAGQMTGRVASAQTGSLTLEDGQTVGLILREVAADMAAFDLQEADVRVLHDALAARNAPSGAAATAP
jgi:hypothetical protein